MPIDIDRLRADLADRYTIEREIGRGGMATVYLAEDLKHSRQVAVKVLEPELASSLGSERFLREIETVARLNHPHVLPLHDSGEADGFLYYVMPYMEGDSLRDRLDREGQLPVEDAVQIVRKVAGGLDYAHERGIVHRDIKPGNIMLSAGHAVIADFGIARAVSEAGGASVTKTGMSLGSPTYMSPEQASGSETLDGRSDIYALGCVLYEMLAGEPPYGGKSAAAIMARKSLDAAPSLRAMRDTVPPGVEQAVNKALARVPADRFATADQFGAALKVAMLAQDQEAAAIGSDQASVKGRALRTTGRARQIAAPAIMAVVLAAVAIGWWLTRERGATKDATIRSVAVLPFADMSPEGDQAYLGEGIAEVLLNALSKMPNLRVPGRSSSFQFDERNPDVREVGRALDVEAVVEGSVRADEDTVRFTAQLVSTSDGFQLWSESYTRGAENIFAIQEEIAHEIVAALGVQLAGGDTTVLVGAQETLPEVYDLYLRGKHHLSQGFDEAEEAKDAFLQAIALDSEYAPAYAGLATAYGRLRVDARGEQGGEVVSLQRSWAERALALDDQLPEAVAAHAEVLRGERRFEEAEREFLRALELSPGNTAVRSAYADLLTLMRRPEEAIRQARQAVALDPLSITSHRTLMAAFVVVGRHEDVLEEAGKILELNENHEEALGWMSWAYAALGRYEEAIDTAQRMVDVSPDAWMNRAYLAYAYALSGDREVALRVHGTAQELDLPLHESANIYAMLGDLDTAYDYLERALVEQPERLFFLDVDPASGALRADPRWNEFWARYEQLP